MRPESVDVQLYGNGKPIGDTVQLSEKNNWTYTFTDLPVYYLYNDELTLKESDYSITPILEDDFDSDEDSDQEDELSTEVSALYKEFSTDND